MENNQNADNPNFNLGSGNKQIDLMRISMPDWLHELFSNPAIGYLPDINKDVIDGYPIDDEF